MKILAIDLGKTKSVACCYESESAEHRFLTIPTTPQDLHDLVVKLEPDRVVIEICSAAGWVADLMEAVEVELQIANTAAPAWRWSNTKRKTDRDDALRLAQLSALNQLPQVVLPPRDVRQWRALIRYRHHLVGRRTQIRNRIRALFDRQGIDLPGGAECWNRVGIQALHQFAKPLEQVSPDELWQGELHCELDAMKSLEGIVTLVEQKLNAMVKASAACQLLQTAPGVGPRLAEIVVALIGDPKRFQNRKQVACYAGLTPRQYQSGNQDRQGRISRAGNQLLRSMLVEVSWVGLRYNPWMRSVYEAVRRGSPARKKIAIVAVARRLLIRCWAMLRDHKAWQAPPLAVTG